LLKKITALFFLTHAALNAVLFLDSEEHPQSLYSDFFFTYPEQVSFFNFSSIMDKKLTAEKNKNFLLLNVSLELLKKIESKTTAIFFEACKKTLSGYKNVVIFVPKLESNKRIALLKSLLSKLVGKIDENLIKAQNEDYSEYSAAIATSLRIGLVDQKQAKISSPILHSFTIKKTNYLIIKNDILTLASLHENMQITPVMNSDFNLMRSAWYEEFIKKVFGKNSKIMHGSTLI